MTLMINDDNDDDNNDNNNTKISYLIHINEATSYIYII